jgi:DDE superfamily endonuclease
LPKGASLAAQQNFIKRYEALLNGLEADETVYFVDAVHPEHQSRPAFGWIRKGDVVAVQTTTGRKRINLHGALCLETGACPIVEADTICAQSTINLFEKILRQNPLKSTIHAVLDNARYHHAKDVKAWLASKGQRIKLLFLPPYAPNLNAIERLWGCMHRAVTHNIF